ncbi:MAG: hypothetical protein AAGI09_12640 [Pseudomonadota bacterium]
MPVAADPLVTFVLNRDGQDAEIYMSLPAAEIQPILGTEPGVVFPDTGIAPLTQFRERGTMAVADALIARLTLRMHGLRMNAEAMSLMVHPRTEPQPFRTPWDAVIASSVCTTDDPDVPLTAENSHVYFGAFSAGIGAGTPFAISFPRTGRLPRDMVLREYFEGKLVRESTYTIPDGGQLQVRSMVILPIAGALPQLVSIGLLGMAMLLMGGAVWAAARAAEARRPRGKRQVRQV